MILQRLNISYVVEDVKGDLGDYGKRLANGSWTSYLGALQDDRIDLFMGATLNTEERRRHFHMLDTGT